MYHTPFCHGNGKFNQLKIFENSSMLAIASLPINNAYTHIHTQARPSHTMADNTNNTNNASSNSSQDNNGGSGAGDTRGQDPRFPTFVFPGQNSPTIRTNPFLSTLAPLYDTQLQRLPTGPSGGRTFGSVFPPSNEVTNDTEPAMKKRKRDKEDSSKTDSGTRSVDKKELDTDKAGPRCKNCGNEGHHLLQCARAGPGGPIAVCPLCEDDGHCIDECQKWKYMVTEERLEILVSNRHRKPRWKTADYEWHKSLQAAEKAGMMVPQDLPWTDEFAVQAMVTHKGLIEMYEKTLNSKFLPLDLKTATLEHAIKRFEGVEAIRE